MSRSFIQFLRVSALNSNPLELSDTDPISHVDIEITVRYPPESDDTKTVDGLTNAAGIAAMNAKIVEGLTLAGFTVDTVNPDHPTGQYPPIKI